VPFLCSLSLARLLSLSLSPSLFALQDGFPPVGTRLEKGDPLYSWIATEKGTSTVERYKGEPAQVLQVSRFANQTDGREENQVRVWEEARVLCARSRVLLACLHAVRR